MADVRIQGLPSQEDAEKVCEQSFSTTLDLLGQVTAPSAGSAAALDAGATANLVAAILLWKSGVGTAQPYSARPRFRFGHGRFGEVRHAVRVNTRPVFWKRTFQRYCAKGRLEPRERN